MTCLSSQDIGYVEEDYTRTHFAKNASKKVPWAQLYIILIKWRYWGEHMLGLWKFNILSWGRTLGNAWHVEGKSKLETCVLSNSNLSGHNFCAWLSFHTSFDRNWAFNSWGWFFQQTKPLCHWAEIWSLECYFTIWISAGKKFWLRVQAEFSGQNFGRKSWPEL